MSAAPAHRIPSGAGHGVALLSLRLCHGEHLLGGDLHAAMDLPRMLLHIGDQFLVVLPPDGMTGYQQLMRVHAAMGNRAEAIRAYERCRRLLADELGVDPSPQTEAVYLEILKVS